MQKAKGEKSNSKLTGRGEKKKKSEREVHERWEGYGWPQFCNEKSTIDAESLPYFSDKHDRANLKNIQQYIQGKYRANDKKKGSYEVEAVDEEN